MNNEEPLNPILTVSTLERILLEHFFPALMDMARERLGPLVREAIEELEPTIQRWVRDEVRELVTREVLRRVEVTVR